MGGLSRTSQVRGSLSRARSDVVVFSGPLGPRPPPIEKGRLSSLHHAPTWGGAPPSSTRVVLLSARSRADLSFQHSDSTPTDTRLVRFPFHHPRSSTSALLDFSQRNTARRWMGIYSYHECCAGLVPPLTALADGTSHGYKHISLPQCWHLASRTDKRLGVTRDRRVGRLAEVEDYSSRLRIFSDRLLDTYYGVLKCLC